MSYMTLDQQNTQSEQNQPLLDDYTEDDEFIEEAKKRVQWRKVKKRCLMAMMISGFFLLALCVVVVPVLLSRKNDVTRFIPSSDSVLGEYQHAAVASDVTQCSQIGKDILERKGSAVDAAVASLFCMGVVDPQSTGIGGGFLMTVYTRKTKKAVVIDAREVAPAAATQNMFVGHPELSAAGPLSIAVPGEVLGYYMAYKRFGSSHVKWKDLVQPTIDMVTNGFTVPKSLADALQDDKDNILKDTILRNTYVNPATNELYKTGETLKLPLFAKTLTKISEDPMSFYNGTLMKDIVADMRGSIITEEDMMNYRVKIREPSETKLRNGVRIFSPPPPGSGPVLLFMLQLLDGYSLSPDSLNEDKAVLTYHRIIETFKFGYAKRTYLGDQDFVDVKDLVANLTSSKYADEIRKLITDSTTHDSDYYGPVWDDRVKTGTAHLSVISEAGDAVSVTSTVNSRFGSLIMGNSTGIIFNNEMDDFSSPNVTNVYDLKPSPANFITPGKRPLSSMCPSIAINPSGEVTMVIGAAGGSRITSTTAMVMANLLWFGDNIKQAIDERRLHHQLLPDNAYYEDGFPEMYLPGLEHLHHNMTWQKLGKSIVQGITRENSKLQANSDFRKGGSPDGY